MVSDGTQDLHHSTQHSPKRMDERAPLWHLFLCSLACREAWTWPVPPSSFSLQRKLTVHDFCDAPFRDECNVHDMMYTKHHPTSMGRRFLDFSDFHLFSRTFSFDTCFFKVLSVFLASAYFLCCSFRITTRPGQVFSFTSTASLGGMHVGHFTEDKVTASRLRVGHSSVGFLFNVVFGRLCISSLSMACHS